MKELLSDVISQYRLTHTAYHVGQLVLLAKHFAGDGWRTLSMPRSRTSR